MSDLNVEARELISLIEKQMHLADVLLAAIERAEAHDVPQLGKTGNAAVMVAGLIENYYTCLETAYLKISQHFENHLNPSRRHAELLEKMTLHIEGVRIPAVSDASYTSILELQRFRHFKRYHFDLEYDWDRMEFLLKKVKGVHPLVCQDLTKFIHFLKRL
jgi:hypothetical protein